MWIRNVLYGMLHDNANGSEHKDRAVGAARPGGAETVTEHRSFAARGTPPQSTLHAKPR